MANCVICHQPLILLLDEGDDDENVSAVASSSKGSFVDDDVHLPCDCHFHWQCLLDASYEVNACPNCRENLIVTGAEGNRQLLCNLQNEGGLQEGLDILPILTEESYLKAYPEERKCRAFLQFCTGDIEAILSILSDDDEEGGEEEDDDEAMGENSPTTPKDILRYQDQLGSMDSGLHIAVQNQKTDVAWLLLLLASNMGQSQFPAEVLATAQSLDVMREDQTGKVDIRALKDVEGRTANDRATAAGGVWESWVSKGLLQAP